MPKGKPKEVTLNTLHEDLSGGFADLKTEVQTGFQDLTGEVRGGFADLKTTLVSGFRSLPTRESSEEMIRLLREGNRFQDERLTQLDVRIREQHFEIQQALRGIADGFQALVESQRALQDGVRALLEGQRELSADLRALIAGQRELHDDIRALIARLDALIKGRGDGASTP